MAGNFFYSKVYKGGFDIKSLENVHYRKRIYYAFSALSAFLVPNSALVLN